MFVLCDEDSPQHLAVAPHITGRNYVENLGFLSEIHPSKLGFRSGLRISKYVQQILYQMDITLNPQL